MASPSVTYTFSNSTTADATQVNQNFTDLINGITDGTKDLSISALTCAGNATLNGNTTIGNASGDDFTLTASLASSIPIKTHNSYDIGAATTGLRYLYFASSSATKTAKLIGPAISSDIVVTLPALTCTVQDKVGQSQVFLTNGNGHGSSSTTVRRYTNAQINTGSDLTYADSATLGGTVTVNTTGLYYIQMQDTSSTGAFNIGITVNSSALTTNIQSITWAQGIRAGVAHTSANFVIGASTCLYLTAGDIIRAQTGTEPDSTVVRSCLNVIRIA